MATKTGNETETLKLFFGFTKGKCEFYSRIYPYTV